MLGSSRQLGKSLQDGLLDDLLAQQSFLEKSVTSLLFHPTLSVPIT